MQGLRCERRENRERCEISLGSMRMRCSEVVLCNEVGWRAALGRKTEIGAGLSAAELHPGENVSHGILATGAL